MNQNPLITIADWHGRNGQDFEATVIREAVEEIARLKDALRIQNQELKYLREREVARNARHRKE